jgi:two-component system sensor histidine kinase DesK
MRLLPKGQDWTAYAWLIYLAYFALTPFFLDVPAWEKAASWAATGVAVPLYFSGYWLRGRRVLWTVAGFLLLATLTSPINPASSVFFVYAASYLGKSFEPRLAYRYLIGILVLIGLETWLFHYPEYVWIPALAFTSLIGSVIIQQCQKNRIAARLLVAQEEAQQMAAVAERERIGRDLHDLLGHTLSVIVLKSELASKLAEKDPARAAREIREVEQISREALAEVRSAVQGYRGRGIGRDLADARRALESAGIRIEESVDAPALPAAQERVLGLALREAVTNVVRHAHATVCRLTLRREGGWCELEVADDGRGGELREGSGLAGMRERVEALGGILERQTAAGTRLRIRVPV